MGEHMNNEDNKWWKGLADELEVDIEAFDE